MTETVCYCFGYTDADIVDDVLGHGGRSTMLERITEAKKNGVCNCEAKNPKGRRCLSDVHRVVDKAVSNEAR
ncbi:MAG: hypothetical protein A2147_06495 [Chloroflexi bacterium RBG_16_57_8]|nr:MAG: hypothetical protein A2147_06495 [Chloroflexi bacterium RBG_16_57_8]